MNPEIQFLLTFIHTPSRNKDLSGLTISKMQLALLVSGFVLFTAQSALAASGTTTTTWDWYA